MARYIIFLVLALAACGSSGGRPPSNLDNACEILEERREYRQAFSAVERKWNVPTHVLMAVIYQESKFISNARTPYRFALGVIPVGRQSSAFGYSQALDGTWDDYKRETGQRRAKRHRIKDASDFMGWYMNKTLQRNGIALDDTRNQYLAYHEGHTGYARRSYLQKPWLIRVADTVNERANLYEKQLQSCS